MSKIFFALPLFCLPYVNLILPLIIIPLLSVINVISISQKSYWMIAQFYNIGILSIILFSVMASIFCNVVRNDKGDVFIWLNSILLKHHFTSIMYTGIYSIWSITKSTDDTLSLITVILFSASIPFQIYLFIRTTRELLAIYMRQEQNLKNVNLVAIMIKDLKESILEILFHVLYGLKSFINIIIILIILLIQEDTNIDSIFICLASIYILIELSFLGFLVLKKPFKNFCILWIKVLNQLILLLFVTLFFSICVFYTTHKFLHLRYDLLNVLTVIMIPVQYAIAIIMLIKKEDKSKLSVKNSVFLEVEQTNKYLTERESSVRFQFFDEPTNDRTKRVTTEQESDNSSH
mmetsp:Transcript_11869/g.10486  ORF Transcript_11869/g.10486 Transcript_11869/m.10486 type:complete len:348 (+) Transcript_11869:169-1212(+)